MIKEKIEQLTQWSNEGKDWIEKYKNGFENKDASYQSYSTTLELLTATVASFEKLNAKFDESKKELDKVLETIPKKEKRVIKSECSREQTMIANAKQAKNNVEQKMNQNKTAIEQNQTNGEKKSVSQRKRAKLHKQLESLQANKKQLKITSDAPDLSERSQQHSQDMIIADHRPLTKIYTKLPLTNQVQVCRAQRIHSDTDQLSMVHIEPSVTLQSPPIEQPQHMTLLITVDQHISRKEEHIPINDSVRTMDVSLPSNNKATEIPGDSGISLNITAHITDQPLVLNVSEMHQTEVKEKQHIFI